MATNKSTKKASTSKKIVASKKGKFNLAGWQKISLMAVGVLALAGIAYAGLQVYENLSPSAASGNCASSPNGHLSGGTPKLYKSYSLENSGGKKLSGTHVCIYSYKESKFKGDYVLSIANASTRTMFTVWDTYELRSGNWKKTSSSTSEETKRSPSMMIDSGTSRYHVVYPYVKYGGIWYHAKVTMKYDSVSVGY